MTTRVVSKLGLHSEGAQNTGLQEYCRALLAAGRRPAVVDSHDNYSAAFDAAQIDQTVLTIGDLTDFEASFDITLLRAKAAQNPHIKVWQVYNEIDGDWVGQADRLINIMQTYGDEFKFCIFNCADGTPHYPHEDGGIAYSNIARACKVAKAGGHYLGLHGYGFDFTDHLFRYRDLAEYLRSHDALCDIVLTEYGPDEGSFIGVDAFMSWCRMVDVELMKDDYIIGAALWTMGRGAWQAVDFSPALSQLAEYQATISPVVEPRRYDRVCHLVPPSVPTIQDANGNFDPRYLQILAYAGPGRESVIASADDAFINPPECTTRKVYVYNVAEYDGQAALEEWVQQYYPPLPEIIYRSVS